VRGLFVTGTDTGVGKTIVSAALLASMAAAGERVRAYKPAVTGLEDPQEAAARGAWPPDHELLGLAAGMDPELVSPLRFGPAVSPHLAARLSGQRITSEQLLAGALAAAGPATEEHALVVEGVGGLLVPLSDDYAILDLAVALALPLLIVARPGLGTINHTLLTIRAARGAGLEVRAVVLTPWPAEPTTLELSNRESIQRLGQVPVEQLEEIAGPELSKLAPAGDTLPWRGWLGASGPEEG
jgi:dethiobiotin synthetase